MGRALLGLLLVVGLGAAEQPVRIDLPPKVDLAKLTELVGEVVEVTMQYNPQRLRGEARLALRGSYSAEDLWAVYNQVLAANGFVTVLTGMPPVYQVVQQNEAAKIGELSDLESYRSLRFPPSYLNLIYELDHLAPETAVQLFTPLLGGQQGQIKALGKDESRLLLSGLTLHVETTRRLLERFDLPTAAPAFRQVEPTFSSPQKLMASLQAAWAAAGRVHGHAVPVEFQQTPDGRRILVIAPRDRIEEVIALAMTLDRSEPVVAQTYRSDAFPIDSIADLVQEVVGQEPGSERLRIVRDRLTESLIIYATAGQHERIAKLVDDLGSAPAEARRQLHTFGIQHRQAADMATLLEGLLASGASGSAVDATVTQATTQPAPTVADPTNPGTGGGPATEAEDAGQAGGNTTTTTTTTTKGAAGEANDLAISVDEATNSLLVVGSPRQIDQVAELIEQLDVRRPQVELEILMVNLTDNDERTLGINLAGRFMKGETSFNLGTIFGLEDAASEASNDSEAETPPGDPFAGLLDGASGLVLEPGDFATLIQAIETVQDGRKVIRTKVLVDNNQEASIDGVVQQPISSINSGDQVATTTFSGTSDAGTQIELVPQISAGDQLTLTYAVSQSGFTGAASSENLGVPPPKRSDALASVATIPDGFTVVLGGLRQEEEGLQESRVPILGSIPFLGWLFRRRATSVRESTFYVFIRASVMRHKSFEDLKYTSARDLDDAGLEDESWPTLMPRFIDQLPPPRKAAADDE